MLKDMTIRSLANEAAYGRGERYYRQGRVQKLTQQPDRAGVYTAEVSGSEPYAVTVRLSKQGDNVTDYACTCPAAELYLGACKHVVATLLAVQQRQLEEAEDEASGAKSSKTKKTKKMGSEDGRRLLCLFSARVSSPAPQRTELLHLVPRLFLAEENGQVQKWLEFRIGADKLYVVRNLQSFLAEVQAGETVRFGKNLTVDTRRLAFADEISEKLWQMLREAERDEMSQLGGDWHTGYYSAYLRSYLFDQKMFRLTPGYFDRFLAIMGDTPFETHFDDEEPEDVRFVHGRPALRLSVQEKRGHGAYLRLLGDTVAALDEEGRYFYTPGQIYAVDEEFSRAAQPLLEAFGQKARLSLAPEEMQAFFEKVQPAIEGIATVEVDPKFEQRFQLAPLHAAFYLDYHGEGIEARPVFSYGEVQFNPLTQEPPRDEARILVRSEQAEHELMSYFLTYGFHAEGPVYVQEDEERSYDFLTEALPALSEKADVFYTDAFAEKPVQKMPKVTAGVSVSDDNLLEVTFDSKNIDFDELMEILRDYRKKRRYHRLKDGTFVTLGEQQLGALADFVESTGIKKGAADEDGKAVLPLSNAMYLDSLAREEEGLRLERSKRFRHLVRDIRSPQDADVAKDVPPSLAPVLRDYQVTGFNWLETLASVGLGGILADDMGLGKTLQVITFLLAEQDETQPPSLVACPASLVYNWLDEIERFAPQLRAKVIAGTKAEREKELAATGTEADVLITTYNMLKRDIDLYRKRTFRYLFLDEAQHIKNPATQNAKAVKRLKAKSAFALTGTPIENTLTELWSIFDFLMPGYLLSHEKFKARYEIPIVREENPRAVKSLQRHVMPFILRRLKKDVLTELPDKVERRMTNEMTPKQNKVYQAYFVQGAKEYRELLKEHGLDGSRLKILAILTRLRQICCDPALFLEDYDGGSGKLDQLEEIVTEAVGAGHRLLIFSQFTTMLAHIGARLEKLKISYLYLDGSTPALTRLRLVKAFNAGEGSAFLISLKAGGTGLNLTGADMVVHYDPWWNPAVEDQATDRAYRLGQQNNVQVLKLITKDTIEEKIYRLQEKKKSLIDQMLKPGETFITRLSDAEIAELFER